MASVYIVTNLLDGMQYVGYTVQAVSKRWEDHWYRVSYGSDYYFHRALRKYGRDVFEFRVLYDGLSADYALALEVSAIKSLGTVAPGGYNLTDGGEGTPGHRHTDETKERMSAAKRGRTHSIEHADKVADSRRGRKNTDETKAKMSAAKQGHALSDQHRAAMDEGRSRLRNPPSPELLDRVQTGLPKRQAAVALVAAGATQTEAARRVGTTQASVSNWVRLAKAP